MVSSSTAKAVGSAVSSPIQASSCTGEEQHTASAQWSFSLQLEYGIIECHVAVLVRAEHRTHTARIVE